MSYARNVELPSGVKNNLPKHAQSIYRKAYDNAFKEYKEPGKRRARSSREETAHKVAWSAVKSKYKKDRAGEWEAKSAAADTARKSTRKPRISAKQKSIGGSAQKAAAGNKTKARRSIKKSAGKSGGKQAPQKTSSGRTVARRETRKPASKAAATKRGAKQQASSKRDASNRNSIPAADRSKRKSARGAAKAKTRRTITKPQPKLEAESRQPGSSSTTELEFPGQYAPQAEREVTGVGLPH